jgi:hypothetical protein
MWASPAGRSPPRMPLTGFFLPRGEGPREADAPGRHACPVGLPVAAAQPTDTCPLNFMAIGHADGSVTFHWSGFGGADGYQVFGRLGMANTAGYSPMLDGGARDYTSHNLAAGSYVFWVTAYHSGTVVASSCERSAQVGAQQSAPCPATVNATVQPPHSVVVAWSRIAGATGYQVARAVDGGALVHGYATVIQSAHPGFTDGNAPPGHAYTYRVVSSNTRSPPEACQPVTVEAPAASVPFFPSGAALAGAGVGSIGLAALILRRK